MEVMLIFHNINCLCEAVPLVSYSIQPVLWLSLARTEVCYFMFRLKRENYNSSNI